MKTLSETRKTVGKLGGNPILLNQKLNLNTENEYSINVLTVKTSENGKKSENGYSGNFKARGEEVMAKRLREGIEAANKAGGIDSGGEE